VHPSPSGEGEGSRGTIMSLPAALEGIASSIPLPAVEVENPPLSTSINHRGSVGGGWTCSKMLPIRFLQANLNHSRGAHDLVAKSWESPGTH